MEMFFFHFFMNITSDYHGWTTSFDIDPLSPCQVLGKDGSGQPGRYRSPCFVIFTSFCRFKTLGTSFCKGHSLNCRRMQNDMYFHDLACAHSNCRSTYIYLCHTYPYLPIKYIPSFAYHPLILGRFSEAKGVLRWALGAKQRRPRFSAAFWEWEGHISIVYLKWEGCDLPQWEGCDLQFRSLCLKLLFFFVWFEVDSSLQRLRSHHPRKGGPHQPSKGACWNIPKSLL